jgi:hypothetical protein
MLAHRPGMTVQRDTRHCEEQREEAIQTGSASEIWIASLALAMTKGGCVRLTLLRILGKQPNQSYLTLIVIFSDTSGGLNG